MLTRQPSKGGSVKLPYRVQRVSAQAHTASFDTLVAREVGQSFRDVAHVVREGAWPTLGPGDVLVRVMFAGVNGGCETFRVRGEHAFQANRGKRDFGLGAEGAGVIAAVGPGVSLKVGQAVACNSVGFREFAVAREAMCVPVPKASAQAAALVLSGVFACVAIDVAGGVSHGQNVLITAGGGAAGSFAISFAKLAGARVVTTVGSAEKAALARRLGADVVLNHREVDIADALASACPEGFDVVMDGVGGALFSQALERLAPSGRLLVTGYISEYPHTGTGAQTRGSLPPLQDIFWNNMDITLPEGKRVTSRIWSADRSKVSACRDKTFQLFDQGRLQAIVDPAEFSTLAQVSDAVDYMLSGRAAGKVVVKV